MIAELFVYGTLRRGSVNPYAALLSENAAFVGPAKVKGRLYLVSDYPGAVPPASEEDWVHGELWRIGDPETVLPDLDAYEGCAAASPSPHEFRRALTEVSLETGKTSQAWIYWYAIDTQGKHQIQGGDFPMCETGPLDTTADTKRLRIAFVVQRYGPTIAGGSEHLCRVVAERLARRCDCDVLTTCAEDYMTWKDVFAPGTSERNGVQVRRFPVDHPRDVAKFNSFSGRVFGGNSSLADEETWMKLQGPYSSALLNYIRDSHAWYDAFVFFTYLYATTYFGLPLVKDKAILVPTAHDEPPIYLSIFESFFHLPRRLLFLTEEEQEFVCRRFCLPAASGEIAGMGIDTLSPAASRALPKSMEGLNGHPYVLYLGRIDPSKGCETLIEYFTRFVDSNPSSSLRLVLAGKPAMPIPEHDRVIATGYLSDEEKVQCIQSSSFMVAPSPYESLCIAALEAWMLKKPVLGNGECEVLAGQCRRSGGGLWYKDYAEFEQGARLLSGDPALRDKLGASGSRYVAGRYTWEGVEDRYFQNILAASQSLR